MPPSWPRAVGATGSEDWNGFAVLHTAAARVAGLDLCVLPGADGGLDTRKMLSAAGKGELDVVYLLGADEIKNEIPGRGIRDLSGQPRRCRCTPGRCHFARCCLHRKIRHLRQYRRPCTNGDAGRVPTRRCPRRLDHSEGPCRMCLARRCPTTPSISFGPRSMKLRLNWQRWISVSPPARMIWESW